MFAFLPNTRLANRSVKLLLSLIVILLLHRRFNTTLSDIFPSVETVPEISPIKNVDASSAQPLKVKKRTLVIYSYLEKSEVYANRLRFFLDCGISPPRDSLDAQTAIDYLLIVQDFNCSVGIPDQNNIYVLRRENTCFDYGAIGKGIEYMQQQAVVKVPIWDMYDYFVILNPSAIGPFLPSYWPDDIHWTQIFISRLTKDIKLVGPSIDCLPREFDGGFGPKVEGYAWATDSVGMKLLIETDNFKCFANKAEVVQDGEYKMTRTIIGAGYTIDSLMIAYDAVDWRDTNNWSCNGHRRPTRFNQYHGINVHPLEVVFHKTVFVGDPITTPVFEQESDLYMKWMAEARERRRRRNN